MLVVIDALTPEMLDLTLMQGGAPTLQALLREGDRATECIAPFPSVTPVCAATIATGSELSAHNVPSMNWFHRDERRYVEYGTSFKASQRFGLVKSLNDTIYNLNRSHLSSDTPTIFELLDDAEVRTAATNYLIYRGRHRHDVAITSKLGRLVGGAAIGGPVFGPREFFYGGLFATQKTACRAQFGIPGQRDQHSACVGKYLVEEDLCDFLLLSLPDNDTYSHRHGPASQTESIAEADRQLAKVVDSVGGVQGFLNEYGVIVCSDHAQSLITDEIDLFRAFTGFSIREASNKAGVEGEIAVCPASRSAQIYVLRDEHRSKLVERIESTALKLRGVDLVISKLDADTPEVSVRSERGELRFGLGNELEDLRGRRWAFEGDPGVLDLEVKDGIVSSPSYPDALGRIYSAVECERAGDVLLSAEPGYEFTDWGGAHHVDGGSHGSLHAVDSLALLMWCGTGSQFAAAERQWALQDIAPMVLNHFDSKIHESIT
jgi:hypothetical protein